MIKYGSTILKFREVERAAKKRIPINCLRLEDVSMSSELDDFLGRVQWIDAISHSLKEELQKLINSLK